MKSLNLALAVIAFSLVSCDKPESDSSGGNPEPIVPVVIPDGNFLTLSPDNGKGALFSIKSDSTLSNEAQKIVGSTPYGDFTAVFHNKTKGYYMATFEDGRGLYAYDVTSRNQVPGATFVRPMLAPVEKGNKYYALEQMEDRLRLVCFTIDKFSITVIKDSLTGVTDTKHIFSSADDENVYFMCNSDYTMYKLNTTTNQLTKIKAPIGVTYYSLEHEKKGKWLSMLHEPGGSLFLARLELNGNEIKSTYLFQLHSFIYFGSPESGTYDVKSNCYFHCSLIQSNYVFYRMDLTKGKMDSKFIEKGMVGLESMN